MKHLKCIALLAAMLLPALQALQARTISAAKENPFSKTIQRLKTPAVIIEKNRSEKVKVLFSVDEKGKVNDVFVVTSNEALKKDLTRQFMQLNFKGLSPCVMNSIVLNFVLY